MCKARANSVARMRAHVYPTVIARSKATRQSRATPTTLDCRVAALLAMTEYAAPARPVASPRKRGVAQLPPGCRDHIGPFAFGRKTASNCL